MNIEDAKKILAEPYDPMDISSYGWVRKAEGFIEAWNAAIEKCAEIANKQMDEHQGINGDDCSFEVAQTIRNLILSLQTKPASKGG